MVKAYTLLIISGICCVFAGCRPGVSKQVKAADRDTMANSSRWKLVKLDTESFYQPAQWHAVKQNSCSYFACLSGTDKTKYFDISKYKMSAKGITPVSYLHEMYKTLRKNTAETFDGYNVKRLTIGKNEIYSSEIFITAGSRKLISYSMIFTDNDYLYKIGVKAERPECVEYKKDLDNIVFNLKINGKYVFDPSARVENEHVVDLSKI